MLSILIPVYNQDITKLVQELHRQCSKLNMAFELLVFDDGSTERYKSINRSIEGVIGINYVELSENIGRSCIRNRLAKSARYDYCIFLDSDSTVKYKTFVKRYREAAIENVDVAYGGTSYRSKIPKNTKKHLHWKYGSQRESPTAKIRNKRPLELFHSNNFMAKRNIILDFPFDESIEAYGYEDLEWAHRVSSAAYQIIHIDNPIEHTGLKATKDFLNDIEHSIDNLIRLKKEKKIGSTRLTKWYDRLANMQLLPLLVKLLNRQKHQIYNRLFEPNPKLIYLDLYKLHYFEEAMKNERK